jgi:rubrerythrin
MEFTCTPRLLKLREALRREIDEEKKGGRGYQNRFHDFEMEHIPSFAKNLKAMANDEFGHADTLQAMVKSIDDKCGRRVPKKRGSK